MNTHDILNSRAATLLACLVGAAIGLLLGAARVHHTAHGDIIVQEDEPALVAIIPDPVELELPDFDYELRDQLAAFAQANGHYQASGKALSCEDAEAFADACMAWPDPRWACCMGLAESGGDSNAVNRSSGALGWWQLLGHRASMKRMGLDIDLEADRTTYAITVLHGPKQRTGPWAASKYGTRRYRRKLDKFLANY